MDISHFFVYTWVDILVVSTFWPMGPSSVFRVYHSNGCFHYHISSSAFDPLVSLLYKDPCDYIIPKWIIWDNLHNLSHLKNLYCPVKWHIHRFCILGYEHLWGHYSIYYPILTIVSLPTHEHGTSFHLSPL